MDSFTDADRDRVIDVANRLEAMERTQRATLRRVRHIPGLTAAAIVKAVSRRTWILIGAGIAIGSALGGVGIELVRATVQAAIPWIAKGHP